jgi:predicted PurR-regulated permease PerM
MIETVPEPTAPGKGSPAGFLSWFPWEKVLIWGLFLLAVYVLRHFFFIIFMTFMTTYIMTNVVKRVTRLLSPRSERAWLQRVVTVFAFALLIAVLYGGGTFLYHPLRTQAEGLVNYVRGVNVEEVIKNVLAKTVGALQFSSYYRGKDGEQRMKGDFEKFREKEATAQTQKEFQRSVEEVDRKFQESLGEKRYRDLLDEKRADTALLTWILENEVDKKFQETRKEREKQWEEDPRQARALYVKKFGAKGPPFEEYFASPQYQKDRELEIKSTIFNELQREPEHYLADFKRDLGRQEYERLRKEGRLEGRFQQFYAGLKDTPGAPPYDYERFKTLRAALNDERAFEAALSEGQETPEARDKRQFEDFRRNREQEFVKDALGRKEWGDLRDWLTQLVPDLTKWLGRLWDVLEIIIQLGMSLLLSFLITFDLPRLRRGLHRLEQSRLRDLYHEIAPGLITFGRLIGRSFQAQGVIAICNTLLTFAAITFLQIQNGIFLSFLVFICSFIPVVGVIISSVPIAVMAIVQPGGGPMLAFYAVLAVLAVHFIETSILNPKIMGDMLHLHPVMVLVILALGEYFFGIWGLLLGVPVAVYIIRYVVLAEDLALSPRAAAVVVKTSGLREVPSWPPPPPPTAPPASPTEAAQRVAAGPPKKK